MQFSARYKTYFTIQPQSKYTDSRLSQVYDKE